MAPGWSLDPQPKRKIGAQVGARIKLRFTIPDLTTEKLPVKQVTVELRGGDVAIPVAAQAPGVVEAEGPVVAEWLGREVAFMVRLQNAKGRYSEWSNVVLRQVVPAVAMPAGFTAESAEGGIALTWTGPGDGWSVFRDGLPLAEVDKAGYLDVGAEVGKSYRYQLEAWAKAGAQRAARCWPPHPPGMKTPCVVQPEDVQAS